MVLTPRRKWAIISGILLSVFMASMEGTVVSTAMPTIASELGGLQQYSWVFTAYLLTSTTLVPVFGKLSDLYGRRRIFAIAMAFFLGASVLCGLATTMSQLIWFRALQGIGAGGVLPLAFIMIGEMFTLEERARFQGVFSGVWGVSSVVGPLLGGFIVDQLTWNWVFFINVIPGTIAALIVWVSWRDVPRPASAGKVSIDYAGAVLLTLSVIALMLGLQPIDPMLRTALLVSAALLFVLLLWVETRAKDPILPLPLFRERLFTAGVIQGSLAGVAMFGSLSFVPLFVQGVLGTTATVAGLTMVPMMLSWVVGSIISSRLVLTHSYRNIALAGMTALVIGALFMNFVTAETSRYAIMVALGFMGVGMGLSIPPFLIAIQSTVARSSLGTATSMLQFSRSIGGTIGTGIMGAALTTTLLAVLAASGENIDPAIINQLIAGSEGVTLSAASGAIVRGALAEAIASIFVIAVVAAALAWSVTWLAPGGKISDLPARRRRNAAEAAAAAATTEAAASEAPAPLPSAEFH